MKKTKLTTILAFLLLGSITLQAKQTMKVEVVISKKVTESFGVRGNCGMCKATIEKAALGVNGVSKASWNKETKEFTVIYDNKKTNLLAIHQAIAKSGYDTELVMAKSSDYDKLPGCCQYDREMSITLKKVKSKKKENDSHDGHNHSH